MPILTPANYQIVLKSPSGLVLAYITDFISIEYARRINEVGYLNLTLPDTYLDLLQEDCQIEVYRAAKGSNTLQLDMATVWFVTGFDLTLGSNGQYLVTVSAEDANSLLRRRYIVYYANSPQTKKTDNLDDMIKAIVRENVASTANDDTGDALTNYAEIGIPRGLPASLFTVQADAGLAPSSTKSFAWREVIQVLKDICNTSATLGTYLAFDVVATPNPITNAVTFELKTYINQRGTDRRYPSSDMPVLLDPEFGNLTEARLTYDYSEAAGTVYAAGQSTESDRVVRQAKDSARLTASTFSKREYFQDARQSDTGAGVLSEAYATLWEKRPKIIFTAKLSETDQTRYGIEYNFGDIVTASFYRRYIDCRIDAVGVSVSNGGRENINVNLQSVI